MAQELYDSSNGAKIAKVIVARAVVYGDENLISPLGYLPNGKLLYVGNPRRVNNEIVPTIISGRLAFLELRDIEYQDEKIDERNSKSGFLKEHNIDIVLTKPEDKLNENNSVYFQFGGFSSGNNMQQVTYDLEGKSASFMTNIGSFFIHREPTSKFFWGASFEYNYLKSQDMRFKAFLFGPNFGYSLIRNFAFSLEVIANLDLSSAAYYEIDNNYSEDPQGFLWGPQMGIRFITSPNTRYKIFGSLTYRIYKAHSLFNPRKYDPNDLVTDIPVSGLKQLQGISFAFGFGFDL
jgi:hypothetical protein